MKKSLGLIAFGLLLQTAFAQKSYSLDDGNMGTYFVDEDMPDGFKSCKLHFTNTSDADVVIQYQKISTDFPAEWGVNFCDNRDCLPNFPESGTYAPIKPQETTEMKIDVFPAGGADSAKVQYAIWDQAKSETVDTLTFYLYARWGLNVQSLNRHFSKVFPNPSTQGILNINASDIKGITLRNINGTTLRYYPLNNASHFEMLLDGLNAASYIVEIQHARGTESHVIQYMP